jgi:hypothetical protein
MPLLFAHFQEMNPCSAEITRSPMAKGPGVSATFRIIAVHDQHSPLYGNVKKDARKSTPASKKKYGAFMLFLTIIDIKTTLWSQFHSGYY